MGMTMAEKILAKAAGLKETEAGNIVMANIDVAMTHDLTGPLAVQSFQNIGVEKVWDPEKIVEQRIDHCAFGRVKRSYCLS